MSIDAASTSIVSPSSAPKLGIIAGGGDGPRHLIDACQRLGREFFVICLEGQAETDCGAGIPHIWISLGAGSKLRALVADEKIGEIVMIGRVRRPSLLELKPDFLALKVLTKIGMNLLGDDALLQGVGRAIEEETGARLIGAHEVFAAMLTPLGVLGKHAPDVSAQKDIQRGIDVAQMLGRADVGQSVIVQQGVVLGLEAIEGTDMLMRRTVSLRREGVDAILVKMAKPQQDNRFDLPTIGPETVKTAINVGLRGIAVEAGRSLFLDREKTIILADEANIFMVGVKSNA